MRSYRTLSLAFVTLVTLLGTDAFPTSRASAQEIQITGPLAGAPAVRRMRLYRQGRIQLEPNFSFTLQDEYKRSLLAGLHAGYYFTDWLGLGVWFGYSVANLDTNLTDEIAGNGVTTDRNRLSLPDRSNFPDQVAELQWAGSLQLEFIPLRGKLSMFQKLFVDTDFYVFAGFAMVGVEERADVPDGSICGDNSMAGGPCAASQTARESRIQAAVTFGAGLSMMFNEFVGLNLNWRGLPFPWNTSGTDESGSDDGDFPDGVIDDEDRFFRFNHMFTVGISIYLPTAPRVTD